jgi:hypothetical protein
MEFSFKTNITESKKSINTCAKIAPILEGAIVNFGANKSGVPTIWAKLEDKKDYAFIAELGEDVESIYENQSINGENWHSPFARKSQNIHRAQYEAYLFEYLTDAATTMVDQWIVSLIEKYQERLANDMK